MYKDILLILPSRADEAGREFLVRGLEVARLMEAHVSGLVVERSVPMPVSIRRPYTPEMEEELARRRQESHGAANAELAAFEAEAKRAGLPHEGRLMTVSEGNYDAVVERARLRSLVVAPFVAGDEGHADLVQALIFGAGRPVLVLPGGGDVHEAAEIAEMFRTLGTSRLIATRLDLARRLGFMLVAAEIGQFRFSHVSTSPRVAEGLAPLNPVSLARLLLSQERGISTPAFGDRVFA